MNKNKLYTIKVKCEFSVYVSANSEEEAKYFAMNYDGYSINDLKNFFYEVERIDEVNFG